MLGQHTQAFARLPHLVTDCGLPWEDQDPGLAALCCGGRPWRSWVAHLHAYQLTASMFLLWKQHSSGILSQELLSSFQQGLCNLPGSTSSWIVLLCSLTMLASASPFKCSFLFTPSLSKWGYTMEVISAWKYPIILYIYHVEMTGGKRWVVSGVFLNHLDTKGQSTSWLWGQYGCTSFFF